MSRIIIALFCAIFLFYAVCYSDDSVLKPGEFDGRCPICKAEGKRSTVHGGMGIVTLADCGNGYYDEDGVYHNPDPCNTGTYYYECSEGHNFIVTEQVY
jgi:hypothetical protein